MNKNKRPHNYYKVNADSEVGKQLQALMDKCNEVSEQARQWAEKHGATSYYESPEGIAGGISALDFGTSPIPDGWEQIELPPSDGRVGVGLPKEGSLEEQEMYALPIVSETEFIAILQFKPRVNSKGQRMPFTFGNTTPICFKHMGMWYVDMPYECEAEDVHPCTEKDFYRRRMAAMNTQDTEESFS